MPICHCNMLQTFSHRQGPERVLFKENRFPVHIIVLLILSQCQPSAITPCQLCIVVLFSRACVFCAGERQRGLMTEGLEERMFEEK